MAHGSFYRRRGTAILVVAVLFVPLIAWGVYRAILSNSNDVRDWLPAEYAETQEYRWFTQQFGAQDFVVASWPGCTLTDERLDEFAGLGGADRRGVVVSTVLADSHRAGAAGSAGCTARRIEPASGCRAIAGLDYRTGRSTDVRGDDVGGCGGGASGTNA